MYNVCCCFQRFTRQEYKKFCDNHCQLDGIYYDEIHSFGIKEDAESFAVKYRDDGAGQYLHGDDIIDVYIADIYDENGKML